MKTLENYILVTLFFLGFILITGCGRTEGPTSPVGDQALLKSQDSDVLSSRRGKRIVVILEGTAVAEERDVPDIDGDGSDDPANCWDVDLVDARTGRVIGTASECLAFADLDGQGPKPVATTTFNFREGTLVQRGKMTLQPVLWDPANNPDVDSDVTLVTGAFPAPGTNNIIYGTGQFSGATGHVRLSGAARDHGNGTATLDCIFIIDLFKRR